MLVTWLSFSLLLDLDVKYDKNYETKYINDITYEEAGSSPNCPHRVVVVCPGENGGVNTLEPLTYGGTEDIVVIDCDGTGRGAPDVGVRKR